MRLSGQPGTGDGRRELEYGGEVEVDILAPVAEVDAALAMYADLTAGRAEPTVGEVEWV